MDEVFVRSDSRALQVSALFKADIVALRRRWVQDWVQLKKKE